MLCCRIKRPACQLEPNFRPNSYGIPIIKKKTKIERKLLHELDSSEVESLWYLHRNSTLGFWKSKQLQLVSVQFHNHRSTLFYFFHFPEKVWGSNGKDEQSLRESEDYGGNGRRRWRATSCCIEQKQLLRLHGRLQPQLHLVHHTGLLLRSISVLIDEVNLLLVSVSEKMECKIRVTIKLYANKNQMHKDWHNIKLLTQKFSWLETRGRGQ